MRCSPISARTRSTTATCCPANPIRTCSPASPLPMPMMPAMPSACTIISRNCGSCRQRRCCRTAAPGAACRFPVTLIRCPTALMASSTPGTKMSGWPVAAAASAPIGAGCAASANPSASMARPAASSHSCASWIRSPSPSRRARCAAARRPSISTCRTPKSRNSSKSANLRAISTARRSIYTTASSSPTTSWQRCAMARPSTSSAPKPAKSAVRSMPAACSPSWSKPGWRPASPTSSSSMK